MAKKNFKSGLDDLFKKNITEINNINKKEEKIETSETVNIEDISDEKVKWLHIKLRRYEKELKLWRTGELNLEKFKESLKNMHLSYDSESNEFIEN